MSNMANNPSSSAALDGGWGWIVVLASFISHALLGALYFGYGVFTQAWITDFSTSAAMAAMVGSTTSAFASMAAPLASYILNRWGCRICHFVGGLMVTVGMFLSSFASSLFHMFLCYGVLGGVGLGLCYVPAVIILSQYFKKRRPLAIGIASSGIGVGSFAFPLLIELLQVFNAFLLQEAYGWRGSMLVLSAIMGNSCACAAAMFPVSQFLVKKNDKKSKNELCDLNRNTKGLSHQVMNGSSYHKSNEFEESHSFDELSTSVSHQQNGVLPKMETNGSFSLFRNFVRHPWMRRNSSFGSIEACDRRGLDEIANKCTESRQLETLHESRELVTSSFSDNHDDVVVSQRLITESNRSLKMTFTSQTAKLFCNPLFYVMSLSNITMFIGMMIVYGLTPIRTTNDFGFTSEQGALLVSVIGFANLVGRFTWGAFSNICSSVNPIVFFVCLRFAAAILTLLSPLASTFGLQVLFCIGVGLAFGAWSLYPIVVAKIFGEQCNSIAFGFLEFFDGVGSIVGPTLGGLIYDISGSYPMAFVLAGISLAAGTAILACGAYLLRHRMPR